MKEVIPDQVLFDKRLKSDHKIVIALVLSGRTQLSNKQLGDILGRVPNSASSVVAYLVKNGYLTSSFNGRIRTLSYMGGQKWNKN